MATLFWYFYNSYTQRLFQLRSVVVLWNCTHANPIFVVFFSIFPIFFVFWFKLLELVIVSLCKITYFTSVSVQVQFIALSFWNTFIFINAVLNFLTFFAKYFSVSFGWIQFLFFYLVRRMALCLGLLFVFSKSRMLNIEMYSFFF